MELSQIIYGLAIIILAAFIAREKIREVKLTKKAGLKANPERCATQEVKINQMQQDLNELKIENSREHENIHRVLGDIRERLSRLEAKINSRRK
ncbi:MAG: hypothetical protein WBI18_03570 [Candidatus Saccharicenans sp.]